MLASASIPETATLKKGIAEREPISLAAKVV